ncbi:hypothetical protein H4R18_003729 [Coemansia javaensis]|uniref:CDT1 Geminin-binding domain-containing protein n=1 Tax=Coemansia javaensis TaxID=2761396 RepID=A0A9W8H7S2_9FUNG|nr:hypothetical protein H4R18_003729 [Coemansia javaensis]
MRVQQRAATLKEFVRVSKRGDGPTGKDGAKPAGRVTRSQAAKLAAAVAPEQPGPVAAEAAAAAAAAAEGPSRKRKLGAAAAAAAEEEAAAAAVASPAKRAARTPRQGRTITQYFAPARGKGGPAEEPAAAAADAGSDGADGATGGGDQGAAAGSDGDQRAARAHGLLKRLRERKRPEQPAAAAATTADETRAIQDAIRARREQAAADQLGARTPAPDAAAAAAASFAAAATATADEERMRDLKRQFVMISGGGRALPREFRKLEELFQGLEHATLFGGGHGPGGGGVVYHRIRKGVESMAKRTFGWRELGQILAVYPESYRHAPLQTTHEGRRVQSVALTPVARGSSVAVEMEDRRSEFRRRLAALADAAHARFLAARGYSEADAAGLSGWHPDFDVETTPAIAPLALQEAGAVARFDREKLKHLLGSGSAEAKDAGVSKSAAGAPKSAAEAPKSAAGVLALPTPTDSPVLQPAGSGAGAKPAAGSRRPGAGASALLERIRAKQRARDEAALRAAAEVPAATRTMHSRLPGVLDAVSFLYYAERKSVLQLAYVADKIVEAKGLERPEATQHLVALAGFVPEWCTISDETPEAPSPAALLRVTRTISLQEARGRLQAKIGV